MTTNKASLKYSLASKKKTAPKLKNVLAQPLPRYWPEITEDNCTELRQELQETLDGENKPENVGIKLGMSSCLRLLKRNEISCLLLSGEIKPKFIATQIIFSIINKSERIPVLIIPELKKLTGETFQVQSLTLAVTKGKDSRLVRWVRKKAEHFPIPDKLVAYYGSAKTSTISLQTEQNNKTKSKPPAENVIIENLYLPRSSSECRAFIPANASEDDSKAKAYRWSDFISLSKHKPCLAEPMEVDNDEPSEIEKLSLKDLLQKSVILQKEKKVGKCLKAQEENTTVANPHNTSADEIVPPKKLKKRKKKHISPETNPPKVFNYVSLKVNKIQANPDKVKKRKKKIKK